ncbi:MAG: sulfurtransferase [Pseudomonadota bacterium]
MTEAHLPLVISAQNLADTLNNPELLVVDLQGGDHYQQAHIPGAVNFDYNHLVQTVGKAGGMLPEKDSFARVLQAHGVHAGTHVVAYDAEGGASAARLIWNLHAFGHTRTSWLNGGLHAWAQSGNSLERGNVAPSPSNNPIELNVDLDRVIDCDTIQKALGTDDFRILDARSLEEYNGTKLFSSRGGHIPGAIHFEWTNALDANNAYQFKPDDELRDMLLQAGIGERDNIAVHCQTHRRSSLSYVMLRHLGFENVRGYAGSWSEWGNRFDTPVEN